MIPFKLGSLSILSEPINYGGIYSTIIANYYWRMVDSLKKDDVVLDGGANIGTFSLAISSRVRRVIAVEPNPRNYYFLVENIERNKITNVIPVNAALTDRVGHIKFEGNGETGHISSNGIDVASTTIDEIENTLGVNFSALKLDIEGGEPAAILGGAVHSMEHVSRIIFELDENQLKNTRSSLKSISRDYTYDEMEEYLSKLNFELYFYDPDSNRYEIALKNIRSGNIGIMDIALNEVIHGFWYTRKTIRDGFSSLARKRTGEAFKFGMVYASRDTHVNV